MLLVFFTLTVFMLVLMLEIQKGCNDDVDTGDNFSYLNYSLIRTPRHNLQTKGVRITEDALYYCRLGLGWLYKLLYIPLDAIAYICSSVMM